MSYFPNLLTPTATTMGVLVWRSFFRLSSASLPSWMSHSTRIPPISWPFACQWTCMFWRWWQRQPSESLKVLLLVIWLEIMHIIPSLWALILCLSLFLHPHSNCQLFRPLLVDLIHLSSLEEGLSTTIHGLTGRTNINYVIILLFPSSFCFTLSPLKLSCFLTLLANFQIMA